MSMLRLAPGELWTIENSDYLLDRLLGDGKLLLRSTATGEPHQLTDSSGAAHLPTVDWLEIEFAAGRARRVDGEPNTRPHKLKDAPPEIVSAKDPRAVVRQAVLRSLDRIGDYTLSEKSLRAALARIWELKPGQFAGHEIPDPSTVRRWLRQRGAVGDRPLSSMISASGRVSRTKRLPKSVHRRMHDAATAYWSHSRMSIGDAYDDLVARLKSLNQKLAASGQQAISIPSRETFRKHVRDIECHETVLARYGKKEADRRFKPAQRGLSAYRPLLLAAMDHTQADFHVVLNVETWRYLGRPYLTVIVDIHSRCVLGWLLSFEPPSIYSVAECIKRANRPKPQMQHHFPDCPELTGIYGRCDEIVVDNGKEFVGSSFEATMTDLGCSIRWAPVASPTHKAIVERIFATLNHLLHTKLPGATFPVAQLKAWGLDPQKDATLTLEQADHLLDLAIGTYHQSLHSSLKETPVHVWSKGVRDMGGVPTIGDDRQLDKMIGALETRKLTCSGVNLFNLTYHDPMITGPLLEDLARHEPVRGRRKGSATARVTIKYNPANIGEIHIWNPHRGLFVTLPCTDPEYAEGLTKRQHEWLQEWQRERNAQTDDERRDLRLKLRAAISSMEAPQVLKRQKRAQARLLSSPKIQELGDATMRLAHASPRHDGMAPIIPTDTLAPERSDDGAKPIRPAPKRKRPPSQRPAPRLDHEAKTPAIAWSSPSEDDRDWEVFQ